MTESKPTKISQRKKLNTTENIERYKVVSKLTDDLSVTYGKKDFSSKYDTAVLVFISDWHLGAKHFDIDSAISVIEYVLNTPNALLFVLGDNLNTAILNAVSNMFEDAIYPQDQWDLMVDLLGQIADEDKLVMYHDGNHERRIYKQTGLSVGKQVTTALNAQKTYAPHFGISEIILKNNDCPEGKFTFRLTSHHGDNINFLKMQNLNPGANLKVVGHWHRLEISDDMIIVPDPETGDEYIFESKNIKLPNAGKTPFEYAHLEKNLSHYHAVEISSAKSILYNKDSNKQYKYPEFIPTMKSIPILSVANNRKKDKAIKSIKIMIDKNQNKYAKDITKATNEILETLNGVSSALKDKSSSILENLYSTESKKPKQQPREKE